MDIQTAVAIGIPAGGAIYWLIRLEGRIDRHDDRYRELRDDVTYIRNRIDRALYGQDR